jgi:hypothetical protein
MSFSVEEFIGRLREVFEQDTGWLRHDYLKGVWFEKRPDVYILDADVPKRHGLVLPEKMAEFSFEKLADGSYRISRDMKGGLGDHLVQDRVQKPG